MPSARPPLTLGESRARRRATAERRRRRRRAGAGAAAGLVAAAFAALQWVGGSDRSREEGPTAAGAPRAAGSRARDASRPPSQRSGRPDGIESRRERAAITGVLSYTPFISRGSSRRREVALTFDDGPSPYTRPIVDILRRERAPATFFVVGQQLPRFTAGLQAVSRGGFSIGLHTENHAAMGRLPPDRQFRQIADEQILLRNAGFQPDRLFRPPQGSYNAATLDLVRGKRMLMVLWSADTSDYTRPGVDAIVERALGGAAPGAIILMHDGGGDRTQTVQALPRIISGLRQRRLRLVSVARLVLDDPPPRGQRRPPGPGAG